MDEAIVSIPGQAASPAGWPREILAPGTLSRTFLSTECTSHSLYRRHTFLWSPVSPSTERTPFCGRQPSCPSSEGTTFCGDLPAEILFILGRHHFLWRRVLFVLGRHHFLFAPETDFRWTAGRKKDIAVCVHRVLVLEAGSRRQVASGRVPGIVPGRWSVSQGVRPQKGPLFVDGWCCEQRGPSGVQKRSGTRPAQLTDCRAQAGGHPRSRAQLELLKRASGAQAGLTLVGSDA